MNRKMSYEEALEKLKEIVTRMESGEETLDGSLKLFEEGTALVKNCNQLLSTAELKIAQLSKGADGAPVESEFAHADEL